MAVVTGRAATRAAALLTAALTLPSTAQVNSIYREALDAASAKDWPAVEELMNKAISERPEARVRRRQTYIPYYYVGLARYQQGDCAGADEWWKRSERQGIVGGLDQAKSIERGRETCRLESERAAQLARVRGELRESSVLAASLLDLARRDGTREIWDAGDPSPAKRHDGALSLLASARELLTDDADGAAMSRARDLLAEAEGIFDVLRGEVTDLTSEWNQALGSQREGVAGLAIEARSVMASSAHLAPYPRQIRKGRADLEGLIGEAERMRSDPSPEYLDGLAARLGTSIRNLKSLTAGPPGSLRRAAESFLAGEYGAVVSRLAEARLGDARSRAHAHMLLAASRYVLYLEGGELDADLFDAALADVKACQAASSLLRPDPRIFSPRFVSFFEESRAAAAAAGA